MAKSLSAEDLLAGASSTHAVAVPTSLLSPEGASNGAEAGEVVVRPLTVLVQFLLAKVNAISGLSLDGDDLDRAIKAPLTRACFILSREFGWTPAQCSELTVGQVLLYLEMLARGERDGI
jgi:hypothetical protein